MISFFPPNFKTSNKEDYIGYFKNTYQMYNTLFKSLKTEAAFKIVSDNLRRPIVFYLGHPSALFVLKFQLQGLVNHSVNEWYEKVFATGVDPVYPEELDNDIYVERLPSSFETWKYREEVYELVLRIMEAQPLELPITKQSPWWCLMLCCEHERIHFETSTLLLRQMDLQFLEKPLGWQIASYNSKQYPQNEMLRVEGQTIILGKPKELPTFSWDNEYGSVEIDVNTFYASKYLVSNGEYLEFFSKGAYENKDYWTIEGWQWKQRTNSKKPLFWVQTSEGFKYRAIFDEIEMPLDYPVDVNYHEAYAFCKWKGPKYRMIRESEYHCIRAEYKSESKYFDIGAFSQPEENFGNTKMKFGSSSPVDMHKPSPNGFYDTYGNVWEWSEDYFRPLPGFEKDPLYLEYSVGCFDQYHQMMLGSSWASTGLSSSSFFRIGFRRHFYQNCGFRLVCEEPQITLSQDDKTKMMYENDVMLSKYLHFNYGERDSHLFNVPSNQIILRDYQEFTVKCASVGQEMFKKYSNSSVKPLSALDLGCGMGRTAFELAREFDEVDAIDYSRAFIEEANRIKNDGTVTFSYFINGSNTNTVSVAVDADIPRERVTFTQADAMNLPPLLGPYDLIIASNLIDRLSNPIQCLIALHPLLKQDGVLIIVSPYTWMSHVTPQKRWIGGKQDQSTFDALKEVMKGLSFEFLEEQTLTLFIREHERKFEFILPHLTVWKKQPSCNEFATTVFGKQ